MAIKRRYMHGKRRRSVSPLKHDLYYPESSSKAGQLRDHSEASHAADAAIVRGKDNDASGTTVTQNVSEYIKVAQNNLNTLIRTGKGDTPKANKLRVTIARLEKKQ